MAQEAFLAMDTHTCWPFLMWTQRGWKGPEDELKRNYYISNARVREPAT